MSPATRLIPLGGLGEVGKNMMVVECDDGIVVIDAGLSFPRDEHLGVDLVLPDFSYLRDRERDIRAVVLTHGHEDHVGALPYLLREVRVPEIWATGLTLGLTSRWGVLRYPWTVAKLLLVVSVILVGGLVIDGALEDLRSGGAGDVRLIAAAAWDVVALIAATALAVFKPGRRLRRALVRKGDDSSLAEPSKKRSH